MRFLAKFLIVTYFILLSPLVTSCAEGDGFLRKAPPPKNEFEGWRNLINPVLQKSYEELQKRRQMQIQFEQDIKTYATLTKDQLQLAMNIHQYNLTHGDVDKELYDDCTKWMMIYEKEIEIARENYDGPAYVFFFEEFVKLTFLRAGLKIKEIP
tara:strand:- start:102 stop:563 length:462 start_codon:yes stop_codon:yes gene_type:complete